MNKYNDVLNILLQEMGMEKGGSVEVGMKLSEAAKRICEEVFDEEVKSKRTIVVLPTNDIFANVTKYAVDDNLSLDTHTLANHSNQHVYITNEDHVEARDWILDFRTTPVLFHQISCVLPPEMQTKVSKVVGTSNIEGLSIDGDVCPQITHEYLDYIVACLNDGIAVTDDILYDDINLTKLKSE